MMQNWFEEAKLGIFIHWGIYAIDRRGGESWPIVREDVSYNDYMKQMEKFNADQYDPTAWADLIERSGAKYAVLTTKHHDGVTLWPTKEEGPCIPRDKGIGDLVGPYLEAIREKGLKTGLYFSHTDWTHLDHFSVITGLSEEEIIERRKERTHFNSIWQESFDSNASLPESYNQKWINFLEFEKRQLSELLGNYGPIDLIWFDVMLERPGYSYRCEEIRNHIHSFSDKTVINSRLGDYGDYETPEQFIPVYPPEGPWEVCMTSNNTWSYTGAEKMYKSLFEIIAMFCECLSMGGNLLLNVGPDEHGIIPDQQIELLEGLGKWVHKHEEAIYETKRGLPHGYSYGLTSLNSSEDVLYLYLPHFPDKGTSIKGIRNDIESITVLGNGASCSSKRVGGAPWLNVPGTLFINVPEEAKDQEVTVLKIVLDGKLDLYNGVGVEIDVN